jgi:hypothetical protein
VDNFQKLLFSLSFKASSSPEKKHLRPPQELLNKEAFKLYSPLKEEGLGVGEALFNKKSFIETGSLTFYK